MARSNKNNALEAEKDLIIFMALLSTHNVSDNIKDLILFMPIYQRKNAILILLGRPTTMELYPLKSKRYGELKYFYNLNYNPLTDMIEYDCYEYESIQVSHSFDSKYADELQLLREQVSELDTESAKKLASSQTGTESESMYTASYRTRSNEMSLDDWNTLNKDEYKVDWHKGPVFNEAV